MWQALKSLLASRKIMVAIISAVAYGVGKLGLKLEADELIPMVAPLWGALFGLAAEDFGKQAAKLKA
jgi:hypothetical protein